MDKNKILAKNTIILGIGQFIPKIIAMITLPILTKAFTTDEYGIYDLIISFSSLAIPLMTLLIQQAVFRFLINEENEIYPEFAEIFIRNKSSLKADIETYNDFINSEYDLSLIIIDRRNIEICSKKHEYLNEIIEKFSECNLENKKIKLLENINLNAKLKCWRQKTDINIYD